MCDSVQFLNELSNIITIMLLKYDIPIAFWHQEFPDGWMCADLRRGKPVCAL